MRASGSTGDGRRRRCARATLLCCLTGFLLASGAGSATAAIVSVSSGTMTFTAAPGEANRVLVLSDSTASGGTIQFRDDQATIAAGTGCSGGGAAGNTVTCTGW